MALFSIVEDAQVILFSKGVYRQVKVYERDGKFYAAQGSGFIRLSRGGQTTVPSIRWQETDGFTIA